MNMLRILLALALFFLPLSEAAAGSSTITTKDAAGTTRTFVVTTDGSGNFVGQSVICDGTAAANCAAVDSSGRVSVLLPAETTKVIGTVNQGTSPWVVSGTVTANLGTIAGVATAAKQPALGTAGTASADVLTVQGVASMTPLLATVTGSLTNISGMISLPTGASTAANQTSVIGTKAAGTAATNSLLAGAVFNSTPLTVTDTQQASLQSDANGYLKVNVAAGGASGGTSSSFGAAMPATGTAIGLYDGTNMVRAKGDETSGIWVNIKAGAGSGGTALADEAAFTQGTTNTTPAGCLYTTSVTNLTTGQAGAVRCTNDRQMMVSDSALLAAVQAPISAGTNVIGALSANQSVNVAQINGVTPLMGNGVTGTGSPRVTIASDGTAISTAGYMSVKLDQTTPGTTNAVSLAQIGGTTIVNGGLAGSQSIGGTVATNVAITDNPINIGGQAVSSENTAVTTARKVQAVFDLVGKQIVLPYANPENFVSGVITTAMTGTTTTSLIAAPAAGLRNYVTHLVCSNAHATVGTDIIIQDGSGGTTIYSVPAAAVYGGASITFPTPLRQPTTATAIFVANVTTGASTKCAASGYKGA